jgi:hypothetical protein
MSWTPLTQVKPLGFTNRGAWAANTAYKRDDVVSYGGATYVVVTDHTSTTTFDGSKFNVWATRGDQGLVGPTGPVGPAGPIGATPQITYKYTSLDPGQTGSVTATGTPEAPTVTFAVPRGDVGPMGPRGRQIYIGSGPPPDPASMLPGDLYLDKDSGDLYSAAN